MQKVTSIYHPTKSQIVKTNGEANRSSYFSNKKVSETYGNYQATISDMHRLGVMADYSWEESSRKDGFGLTVKDFYNDALKYYDLSYADKLASRQRSAVTVRLHSVRTTKGPPSLSLSASWRLSEEDFIRNLNLFDTIRAQGNRMTHISQGRNVLSKCLTDQKYGDVNSQTPSDRWIKNGTYLRLATLTLAYDFGKIDENTEPP